MSQATEATATLPPVVTLEVGKLLDRLHQNLRDGQREMARLLVEFDSSWTVDDHSIQIPGAQFRIMWAPCVTRENPVQAQEVRDMLLDLKGGLMVIGTYLGCTSPNGKVRLQSGNVSHLLFMWKTGEQPDDRSVMLWMSANPVY